MGRSVVLILCMISACSGCRSVTTYSTLAGQGLEYARLADSFLESYAEAVIEADSEKLLNNRPSNPQVDQLDNADSKAVEQIQEILQVKQQVKQLGSYFTALNGLSTTDAPTRAAVAANGIAGSVGKIASIDVPQNVFGIIARNIFVAHQTEALRAEIDMRSDVVLAQLSTYQRLFEQLEKAGQADLEAMTALKKGRLVEGPWLQKGSMDANDVDRWKSARREVILREASVQSLGNMRAATRSLMNSWKRAASDELSDEDIHALITSLNELAIAVAELKSL